MKRKAGVGTVLLIILLMLISVPLAYFIALHISDPVNYPLEMPMPTTGNFTSPPIQPGTGGTGTTGTETTTPSTNESTGGTQPPAPSGGSILCSNSKYSVVWDGEYAALDSNDQLKFSADVDARGNEALWDISDLTCLEKVDLSWKFDVTNLTALEGLTNLRYLILTDAGVSNIAPLARMTKMENLLLGGTKVSDIPIVANMKNLRWITLDRTPVTDASPLYNLSYLQKISLQQSMVSEMPPIENFPYLEALGIGATPNYMYASDENVEECFALKHQYAPSPAIGCG